MRVAFLTLGCKVNSYETDKMKLLFENAGWMVVAFEEQAEVYVVNTCTVTNIADRKSRKMLHRARKMNNNAVVVACGCYVNSADEATLENIGIDVCITNEMKTDIVRYVSEAVKKKGTVELNGNEELVKQAEESVNIEEMSLNQTDIKKHKSVSEKEAEQEHTRAYIKIQDGCNQYCSYCIIPYVRGSLKSRTSKDIVGEITNLVNEGFKEVVITGIHLSSYGVDSTSASEFVKMQGTPLLELLEKINEINGIERIRLGSLEPRIITEYFAERLSKIKKICPHFHLSLQSGDDSTLKRMNRHYTTGEYYNGVCILNKYFDRPAVTTDIIVGFPGETDEEFMNTCQFARKVKFADIHVFKYSRRSGTVADKMENQVHEDIKNERSAKLIKITSELKKEYESLFKDEELKVLLEQMYSDDNGKYISGYTERYIRIAVPMGLLLETTGYPADTEPKPHMYQNKIIEIPATDVSFI